MFNDGVAIAYFKVRGRRQCWSLLGPTVYHN